MIGYMFTGHCVVYQLSMTSRSCHDRVYATEHCVVYQLSMTSRSCYDRVYATEHCVVYQLSMTLCCISVVYDKLIMS